MAKEATPATDGALDFSDVLSSADSPEMAAFKKRVIAVAKKHS